MDTLKIKAFFLINKYKSFSRTAEEFGYTPSAISHMADSLEEELGIKLFNRTRRGIEITDSGKKLYDKFEALLKAEKNLIKSAAELSVNQELSLKIGTFSSIALHILPEILQEFKKHYPKVKITILVDDYMDNWLSDGTADIILTDETADEDNWKPFIKDEFVAVVPDNIFCNTDEITPEDLYKHPFIQLDEKILDDYFDYSKFREIIPIKSIENTSAVYMVKENLGVAVLPELSIKNIPSGVKILGLKPAISRTIGFAYNEKNVTNACKMFVRYIKKYNFQREKAQEY